MIYLSCRILSDLLQGSIYLLPFITQVDPDLFPDRRAWLVKESVCQSACFENAVLSAVFSFHLSHRTSFQLEWLHCTWGSLAEHLHRALLRLLPIAHRRLPWAGAALPSTTCPRVGSRPAGQQTPGIRPSGSVLRSSRLCPSKLADNPCIFKSTRNVLSRCSVLCSCGCQACSNCPCRALSVLIVAVGSDAACSVPSGGLNTERFFYQVLG